MRARIEWKMLLPLMCGISLGCGESAIAPVTQYLEANRALMITAGLTGRITYTTGTIHVYNLATNVDTDLRVSGVNPKFSPDGSLIVCQCSGIKVMNADGTNQRVLNATGGTPAFDPTGTMIAFVNNGIWKVKVDGTRLTQLTDGGHWPAWSPDGAQIAYGALAGSLQQLFIMNADGTNRHQVLTSGSVIDVVWQPSSRILLGIDSGNYDLYSYDPLNPSSLSRLTTSSRINDFEASWSPDGTQISWTAGTSGTTSGIWTMNADGSGKQGPIIPKGRQGSWGK